MPKEIFISIAVVIGIFSFFITSSSNAQFGGIVSEETWFGRCIRQATTDAERQRCAKANQSRISTPAPSPTATPTASSDSSNTVASNPFLPTTAANPNSCRNRNFHINPGVTEAKDDPSKVVSFKRFESLRADPQPMFDGDIKTTGLFGRIDDAQTEKDDAYIAAILTKRQALTYLSIRWKAEPTTQSTASSGGYIVYTGFFTDKSSSITLDPPCFVGELRNVPLNGETQVYELADSGTQGPIKADYILIKRAPLATPNVAAIAEIAFGGVDAEPGEPTPSTAMKGKIYLKGKSDLTLSNVKIYDETDGVDKKSLIATTNSNGNYFSKDISQFSGKRKLLIERNGFQSRRETVSINSGKQLEKNFPLTLAKPNAIAGKVTDRTGNGLANIPLLITKDNQIANVTVTDSDGSYKIEFPDKGSYMIQPMASQSIDSPKFLADRSTAAFDSVNGKTLQRNFQVTPTVKTGTYQLELSIHEDIGTAGEFPADIIGPSITFYQGNTPVGKPIVEIQKFDRKRIPLPFGTTTFTVRANGYHTTTQTITNMQKEDERVSVRLKSLVNPCIKTAFTNVKDFWFCGNEAKAMLNHPESKQKLEAIDAKIGTLRKAYGRTIPQRVVIASSNISRGFFSWGTYKIQQRGAYGLSILCPPPLSNPDNLAEGETITFSTRRINETTQSDLEHITTHEWGHNLDFEKGQCDPQKFRSDFDDFKTMRQLGELLSTEQFGTREVFYDALIDNGYDKTSDAGHPYSNTRETYASAFHAIHDHAEELKRYTTIDETGTINRFSPQLANVIKFITESTISKTGESDL